MLMPVYLLEDSSNGIVRNFWINGVLKKPLKINVCHLKITQQNMGNIEINHNWEECKNKAQADGYEHRPDMEPDR